MMKRMRVPCIAAVAAGLVMLAGCGGQPTPAEVVASLEPPTAMITAEPSLTPTLTPISYPLRLEQVGLLGGWADALAVSGDRAYVRVNWRYFIVVDISDPTQPVQQGRSVRVESGIESLAAFNHTLLIGDKAGNLLVYDTEQSDVPVLVSQIEVGEAIRQIIVASDTAYLAAGGAGVAIVNLEDPNSPEIISNIKKKGTAQSIAVSGNLLILGVWVANPDDNPDYRHITEVIILDISNPANPSMLSSQAVPPGNSPDTLTAVNSLVFFNTTATRIDITDPKWPRLVEPEDFTYATGETAAGDYLFHYNQNHLDSPTWHQALYVYNVAASTHIAQATTAMEPLPEGKVATSNQLVARGRYIYLADVTALRIFDMALDPDVEDLTDQGMPLAYYWVEAGSLTIDIGILGNYYSTPEICVIGDSLHTPLDTWSLAQPDNPVKSELYSFTKPHCGGFAVDNGIVFDSRTDGNILFMNMSDPGNPSSQDVDLIQGSGIIAAVQEDRLYYMSTSDRFSDDNTPSTLYIFDISDPYQPSLLGSLPDLPANHGFNDLVVVGGYAFIRYDSYGDDRIVLDVSDPATITTIENPGEGITRFKEAAVKDGMVFVGSWTEIEIYALDNLETALSTLELPPLTSSDPHANYVSVRIESSRLYISRWIDAGIWRLTVIDVSDPARPFIVAHSDENLYIPGGIYGEYLYFNGYAEGLSIYKLVPN